MPDLAAAHRKFAMENLAGVCRRLLWYTLTDSNGERAGRILLIGPLTEVDAERGDRLAPILLYDPNSSPGLLTSASTRTPGLVTNTDFLPTVANLLGLQTPPGMVGRPMTVIPVVDNYSSPWHRLLRMLRIEPLERRTHGPAPTPELWAEMHDDWYFRSRQQAYFGGLPTVQCVIVVLSVALGWWLRRKGIGNEASPPHPQPFSPRGEKGVRTLPSGRGEKGVRALPLAILWLPFLLLVLPVFSPQSVFGAGALLATTLALPVVAGLGKPGAARALALLPLAALAVIVGIDLLVGTPLLRGAWMSYSVMEGARYYGIGNEYCGALLAAGLGAAAMFKRAPTWLCGLALTTLALLVAWPACGANAGGFLGLAIGFGASFLVWRADRVRVRDAAVLLLLAAVGIALVLMWDLSRGVANQSHIGRAVGSGPLQIALRKVELNAWLFTHSPWALLLLAAGAGISISLRRSGVVPRGIFPKDRRQAGALAGMLAGSLALLLFNDSGVVAAAESLAMAWALTMVWRQEPSALVKNGVGGTTETLEPA
jgi:hypothetical protein